MRLRRNVSRLPSPRLPASKSDRETLVKRLLAVLLVPLAFALGPPPSAPEIEKLDPPNWWAGHSIDPVRVLVRGKHFQGAHVEAAGDVGIGLTTVNANGTYLLVDVRIGPGATPGEKPLRIVTPGGSAVARFRVDAPLPRAGRFQGFSPDDAIYLLMPDRFANGNPANDRPPGTAPELFDRGKGRYYHGGDLQGIIDHLSYLQDLGITTIWMNPVYDNNNQLNTKERYDGQPITDYHGFGAVDFYAVDEHLGDIAKLRELVDRAHALGLKVILDQVANHTGPFHPWVVDPPTPTWFHGTAASHQANTFQTHLLMDPNTPPQLKTPTLDGWFIDILPDLNQDDEEVARYVIQNSLWWVGMAGLDGIRQDTVPYVPRRFWRRWIDALALEYPHLRVVGEVLDESAAFVSFYQGGRVGFDGVDPGIHSLFDYPLYFAIRRAFAQGHSIRDVANTLHDDRLYPDPGMLVTLLGSHDVVRFMQETGATLDGLKLAATLLFTARGVPQWYYGDEIAMRGGSDPDNRRDFPGGWTGDPHDAFTRAGRTPEEEAVFEHTRRLLHLRHDVEALRRGRLVHLAIEEQVYVYARVAASGAAIVALNNGTAAAQVRVDLSPLNLADGETLTDRLGTVQPAHVRQGAVTITLPPRAGAVLVPAR
jgi:glycosidase